jgi:hypothetical protein
MLFAATPRERSIAAAENGVATTAHRVAEHALRTTPGAGRVLLIRPERKPPNSPHAATKSPRDPHPGAGSAPPVAANLATLKVWLAELGKAFPHLTAAEVIDVPAGTAAAVRTAAWPEGAGADPTALSLARRAIEAKRYLGGVPPGNPGTRLCAVPLVMAGLPHAAVVARFGPSRTVSAPGELTGLLQASARLGQLLAPLPAPESNRSTVPPQALPASPGSARRAVARPPTKRREDDGSREVLDLLVATVEHRELGAAATTTSTLSASEHAGRP